MKNWLIYVLVVLVSVLLVFVLFQYYSDTIEKEAPSDISNGLQEVQIYFANRITNPEMLDCSLVFPVGRVVSREENIYEATIKHLLAGPSEAEKKQGYETLIPATVKVKYVNFVDGTVTIDFDENLDYAVGGSCWVSAIRAQIERTLSQWAIVNKVIISINGESETVLQP